MHNVSKPQGTMYSDVQTQTDNVPSVQQANMIKEDKLDSAEAVLLNQMLLQELPSKQYINQRLLVAMSILDTPITVPF